MNFYVRGAGDPAQLLRSVPPVVARLDPNLPIEDLKTMPQQVRENVFLDRMVSTLSASFALLATVLAAVGLYGVLAYTVSQRTREIGLRMALGADSSRVRRMILKQVGWMTLIGAAVGVTAAYYLGRAAASLLYPIGAVRSDRDGGVCRNARARGLWRRLHSRVSSVARAADAGAAI